eukprot:6203668-Pleurochrysis_carterae.AAC.2
MEWERPYMRRCVDILSLQAGSEVLEIGFGFGYSAERIQQVLRLFTSPASTIECPAPCPSNPCPTMPKNSLADVEFSPPEWRLPRDLSCCDALSCDRTCAFPHLRWVPLHIWRLIHVSSSRMQRCTRHADVATTAHDHRVLANGARAAARVGARPALRPRSRGHMAGQAARARHVRCHLLRRFRRGGHV